MILQVILLATVPKRDLLTWTCWGTSIEVQRRAAGQRWLIVSVSLDYIAEAHFPEHVDVASGIVRIGNSSWDIASAAFQGGECKATCITTIVLTDANGPTAINEDLRAEFERLTVRR